MAIPPSLLQTCTHHSVRQREPGMTSKVFVNCFFLFFLKFFLNFFLNINRRRILSRERKLCSPSGSHSSHGQRLRNVSPSNCSSYSSHSSSASPRVCA
ncbi:hypothetical protein VUR80DRAFT_7561 [Thermomyces stellatus]